MNVIYMHTHDSGRYWSPYGYAIPTQNIREFANSSLLFRQAYSAGPTCSPSRAALLTGTTPHSCGMTGLAHLGTGWRLNDYTRHMARYLQQNGYYSVLCGIQHVAPETEMIGYDKVIGKRHLMNEKEQNMTDFDIGNTEEACRFLRQARTLEKPFFLSMGWFSTHREYTQPSRGNASDYLVPPFPLYDCDINRRDFGAYCESASIVDRCVGNILEAVADEGLADNTVIVLTTDHGIPFPNMKCTLYDTGIGVAMLLRIPGANANGRATDALVSQLDIFPTICEAVGLRLPDWLEGKSMMPLVSGEAVQIRGEIFAEVNYHAAYEPKRCIRTDRYKLIRNYGEQPRNVPANIDDSPSKTLLMENGYGLGIKCREYLFDLWMDPAERENLIGKPEYAGVYNQLSHRMDQWMEETDDPLLSGEVPLPEGSFCLPVSSISPKELPLDS